MRSALLLAAALSATTLPAAGDTRLTQLETRWLQAALPVLQYAQGQRLPVDVVVQPQDAAGTSPVAHGFVDGRCKLVLSMRGNPATDRLLDGIEAALHDVARQAIVAHEVGHCWRRVQGAWSVPPADAAPLDEQRRAMEATRREEGFADLVGLAWTLHRHAAHYAPVHAWLLRQRSDPSLPAGHHHDTRPWLALAADAAAFDRTLPTPFEQALALWRRDSGRAAD